jgi:hypothetical protein
MAGECSGHLIGPVHLKWHNMTGPQFLAAQCPGQYMWHSRIPGVPGIRPARHTVPVPGMELVGTLWCPYVIQYILLPSIPSHPQIIAEMAG